MDSTSRSLIEAQLKAEQLFAEVLSEGLIEPGKLESTLTADIHALARRKFGLRRHWHKRIARAGANTVLTYHDEAPDRRIGEDDLVYLDFGPVFEEWEADFGRTYVVGSDPVKHRLVEDIAGAFEQGKRLYESDNALTAGGLYDCVAGLAAPAGWEFGAATAGHLIGRFPHERTPGDARRLSIRHGNDLRLRDRDPSGLQRHWILEIHFVDRKKMIGGFFEELLTLDTGPESAGSQGVP
jgi:Xaa-Pro dipeptidase